MLDCLELKCINMCDVMFSLPPSICLVEFTYNLATYL